MSATVIDTNVLLVANGSHSDVSEACRTECITRLRDQQKSITVIDNKGRILREYQNKTRPNQPKGVGDVFLKWLLQNQRNTKYVHQVDITEIEENSFLEFPCDNLQAIFDPPDRKFAAVANAHPEKPVILQAADCKWLDWWESLERKGIQVKFLCVDDVCRFYKNKFPKKKQPELPKS
ncbi:hypothetical protein FHJ31_22430 [Pseudomonas sp. Fig-3]|uniref:hypothetical protein n=1 Tax=unclassified Pseudomonas TaxID=196821 RepID=UPI0010ED6DA9|nr:MULTISPECIES: hypothetical protein [unclassified Pseudomonas]TNB80173.1 hypothetical protein FHJ31_22430 [Pseudomonas sp. Fig-3]VII92450.1 hypothetical protein [Pseudomonas sp. FG-3G]